jgi:hypothetical protein
MARLASQTQYARWADQLPSQRAETQAVETAAGAQMVDLAHQLLHSVVEVRAERARYSVLLPLPLH